jgi:uncharacterized protein YndB with AHSA1/START domain
MDFRSFCLRVFVDRPAEEVFAAWLSSAALERWFLTKASYADEAGRTLEPAAEAREGCRYRWEWAEGTVEEGEVTQLEPGLLAFTFGEDVGVVVRVGEHQGRTIVELTQSHSMDDENRRASTYVDCTQGWTFFLTNLKSVLEGGSDLRERQVDARHLVNV